VHDVVIDSEKHITRKFRQRIVMIQFLFRYVSKFWRFFFKENKTKISSLLSFAIVLLSVASGVATFSGLSDLLTSYDTASLKTDKVLFSLVITVGIQIVLVISIWQLFQELDSFARWGFGFMYATCVTTSVFFAYGYWYRTTSSELVAESSNSMVISEISNPLRKFGAIYESTFVDGAKQVREIAERNATQEAEEGKTCHVTTGGGKGKIWKGWNDLWKRAATRETQFSTNIEQFKAALVDFDALSRGRTKNDFDQINALYSKIYGLYSKLSNDPSLKAFITETEFYKSSAFAGDEQECFEASLGTISKSLSGYSLPKVEWGLNEKVYDKLYYTDSASKEMGALLEMLLSRFPTRFFGGVDVAIVSTDAEIKKIPIFLAFLVDALLFSCVVVRTKIGIANLALVPWDKAYDRLKGGRAYISKVCESIEMRQVKDLHGALRKHMTHLYNQPVVITTVYENIGDDSSKDCDEYIRRLMDHLSSDQVAFPWKQNIRLGELPERTRKALSWEDQVGKDTLVMVYAVPENFLGLAFKR